MSSTAYVRPIWEGKGTDRFKVIFSVTPTNWTQNRFVIEVTYAGQSVYAS